MLLATGRVGILRLSRHGLAIIGGGDLQARSFAPGGSDITFTLLFAGISLVSLFASVSYISVRARNGGNGCSGELLSFSFHVTSLELSLGCCGRSALRHSFSAFIRVALHPLGTLVSYCQRFWSCYLSRASLVYLLVRYLIVRDMAVLTECRSERAQEMA